MKKKLIILAVIAIVLGGAGYYAKYYSSTADWKTYSNEKYGFQFKYPSNYSEEQINGRLAGFKGSQGNFNFYTEQGRAGVVNSNDPFPLTYKGTISVGSQLGYEGQTTDFATFYGVETDLKGGQRLVMGMDKSLYDNDKLLKKILSTFKFTQ